MTTKKRQLTDNMMEFLDDMKYLSDAPKNTITTYATALSQLNKWLNVNDLNTLDIEVRDSKKYIKTLNKKGLKNTTINTKIAVFRKYFDWLVDEGLIKSNPFKSIDRLKVDDNGVKYLNKKEVALLLASVQNKVHTNRFRDIAIIKFALSTGCRVNAIHRLNRDDIDLENKTVKLYNKKSKKHQVLPLTNGFIRAYKDYDAFRENAEPAFISTQDNRISISAIQRMVKGHLEKVTSDKDLQHIHTIRHTAFTTLAQNGVPMHVIKEYAGHKVLASTEVYISSSNEEIKDASNVLENVM
jgi:site-specific recombinase XerD